MKRDRSNRPIELPKGAMLLKCPNCNSSDLRRNKKGMYICNRCEHKYDLYQLNAGN